MSSIVIGGRTYALGPIDSAARQRLDQILMDLDANEFQALAALDRTARASLYAASWLFVTQGGRRPTELHWQAMVALAKGWVTTIVESVVAAKPGTSPPRITRNLANVEDRARVGALDEIARLSGTGKVGSDPLATLVEAVNRLIQQETEK